MWKSKQILNNSASKDIGLTSAICREHPKPEQIQETKELIKIMESFGVFESQHELNHRMNILVKLNVLAQQWIHDVSIKQRLPIERASILGGKICTFGSFRLGVHHKNADIDALCLAPRNISREDFFKSFFEVLQKQPEVTESRAIKDAFVPVIKMNFDGIEIDLLFARLALAQIPDDLDLRDDMLLKNLDPRCVRSLNGCRVTDEILNLVPNVENFQSALRAIKLWAKKRRIYSNSLGYLGGVSWAMLVARTCQLYPNAAPSTIVHKFFLMCSIWQWPLPILLKRNENPSISLGLAVWDPRVNVADRLHVMPIITPAYPQQNSTFNVTKFTRQIMVDEIKRGLTVSKKIQTSKATWKNLFDEPSFFLKYRHFIVLVVSSQSAEDQLEWCGVVESKLRCLVSQLECEKDISLAHVNPKRFDQTATDVSDNHDKSLLAPNCSKWFIGLEFKKIDNLNIDLTECIQYFSILLHKHAASTKQLKHGMEIATRHITRKQLKQYVDEDVVNRERLFMKTSSASPQVAKKRKALQSEQGVMKRAKA